MNSLNEIFHLNLDVLGQEKHLFSASPKSKASSEKEYILFRRLLSKVILILILLFAALVPIELSLNKEGFELNRKKLSSSINENIEVRKVDRNQYVVINRTEYPYNDGYSGPILEDRLKKAPYKKKNSNLIHSPIYREMLHGRISTKYYEIYCGCFGCDSYSLYIWHL